ncbi:MAG TPA: hypothetical protein VFL83_09225 [Anaeromyxobacter sp.]|nr:hypothetical protein [Anaeromyxobacter sp.]
MWIVFVVAAAFFVAILGMGYFAVQESERERAAREAGEAARRELTCALCDDALPLRPATSDQVVFEVERRIDAELRDVAHALHAHPERLGRIFHA